VRANECDAAHLVNGSGSQAQTEQPFASCAPERHIHVGSKACWDTISDELPQFEAGPPVL
jgi:hypothetical protein